jgi:ribosomal protein L37AE/L43A
MNSGLRMAARTMSFDPDSTSERWHLGRKLTLLLLLVIALALGLVILFRQRTTLPSLVFNLFADISIGLVVGLATRLALRQRNWFVRSVASAALVIIGIIVLGYSTEGIIGLVLPPLGFVRVSWLDQWHVPLELPLRVASSAMNWAGLAYMVIAIDTSWIALRAWRQSTPRVDGSSAVSSRRRRSVRSSHTNVSPRFTFPKIQPRNSSEKLKARRRSERPMVSMSVASNSVKATRSKRWSPLHKKPQIQLAIHEEHRCPYCLEEVKRDDPRGVVECEVCHTLHHKDCWDITGACQVPHLNT